MTMPNTDPTQNPDFIALEMDDAPSALAPESPEVPEGWASVDTSTDTPVEAPSALSTLAGDLAVISQEASVNAQGAVSGSLREGTMRGVGFNSAQGYVTALANGVKAATAESYKRTLRSTYNYSPEQIAALVVSIIPESTPGLTDAPELSAEQQAANAAANAAAARAASQAHRAAMQARTLPQAAETPAPVIDRGILPRAQILKDLAEQSPGVGITVTRAKRNAGSMPRAEITALLVGTEFEGWGPGIKSTKRQLGEVMRTLIRSQDLAVRAITRRDLSRSGREWPLNLESRYTVSTVDGTDDLGSSGNKILIVDLVEVPGGTEDAPNYEIVFTGGNDTLRDRVTAAHAARCGEQSLTATDLLGWFRGVLSSRFDAFDCAGMLYAPGDSAKLDRFVDRVRGKMLREIAVHDMISGAKLSKNLMQGLSQMLDAIDRDYASDVEKAKEREANKVRKQNPDHTQADVDLAMERAVVLSERAGTYLRRLNDAQSYLDGLKKLLGDDTAAIKARLGSIRAIIEPLCDETTRMGAALEFDTTTVEATDAPQGPSLLEMD